MAAARPTSEQRIEKHLIKTGIKEIDEELLLACLCLTRIEKKYNQDFEKKMESHFVESAIGGIVDASRRGEMGNRPDELLHSKDAILNRTDVTVAAGAVRRVANAASAALQDFDRCKTELEALRHVAAERERRLMQQDKQLRFLNAQLQQLSSPEAIYEAFKSVWENESIRNGVNAAQTVDTMKANMSEMQQHKVIAALVSKEALARQQLLDTTSDNMSAVVGDIDIEKISAMFRDQQQDHEPIGVVDTQLKVMELVDNENDNRDPPALTPATEKMLAEQSRQCDYHVGERVAKLTSHGIKTARQAAEAILGCDEPVQFSRQSDNLHFVIRRTTANKSDRTVRMQGSSTSIVGKLASAILYSPASFLQIEVDMKSTLGRKQQLQLQAHELNLNEVWNELCLYSNPFLNLVHFRMNKSLELQAMKKDFDVRPLIVDDFEGIVEFDERRKQQEKRLAFRRLEDGLHSAREVGIETSPSKHFLLSLKDDREHMEHNTQLPGIVSYVSHLKGKSTEWRNPIDNGSIRVSASSMMKPSDLTSIVRPFRDRYSNFFCTKDEPGQYIEISFEQMSILPTGYSISCTHPINCGSFPRSWRLDASSDRVKWSTLLRHVNDESLNRYAPTWAWTLPREVQQSSFYSHFRIVNEGPNASSGEALCVSSFEIYGKLIFITPDRLEPEMSDATLPNIGRPMGFTPFSALPVPKETKTVGKAKAKK